MNELQEKLLGLIVDSMSDAALEHILEATKDVPVTSKIPVVTVVVAKALQKILLISLVGKLATPADIAFARETFNIVLETLDREIATGVIEPGAFRGEPLESLLKEAKQ